ncbi:hypothetical protein PIROE2DRAFT_8328 [Piromyces sp. E2]|nr:hypothetical protein PIROE2DRAFT_8328 [Piromyces sp. E2]|eukprot:OUM64791.1 hypothetical protein PIROE2DRAFT_8328 [Piromyces sp. E2]
MKLNIPYFNTVWEPDELGRYLDRPKRSALNKLRSLSSVQGYIMEFKYSDESTWNEQAKMDAFIAFLNQQIAVKILEIFPGTQNLILLSREEKEMKKENLCIYCGSPDHTIDECPKRKTKESRNSTFISSNPKKPCGSAINLIDENFCKKNKIHYTFERTLTNVVGIGGKTNYFRKNNTGLFSHNNHLPKLNFKSLKLQLNSCLFP